MNIFDKANIIMISRYKRKSHIAKRGFSTEKNGIYLSGAEEDRTPDLSIANAALSQLSYGPNNHIDKIIDRINTFQYKATHFELEVMRNNFEMNIKNMEIFFINSA